MNMRRRVAAMSCCLSLVHVSVLAADDAAASRPAPLTVAIVNATPTIGPVRNASLNSSAVMTYIGETKSPARPRQDSDDDRRPWVERHPVWTGAILGFAAGFALTYLATHDSNDGRMFKVMSPGAAGVIWGGVSAGVGALAGWGISRSGDDD